MSQEHALPAELNIYAVGPCAERGRRWLTEVDASPPGQPLALQADQVEEIDAAGVQLLVALSISLEERGRPLLLLEPSQPLQRALHRLGAQELLGPTQVQEGVQ